MYLKDLEDNIEKYPIIIEGRSKVIREVDPNHVLVKLKPTLHSFKYQREGEVEGTDLVRLKATKVFWSLLEANDIKTAMVEVGDRFYLAKKFEAPPIEVIVKSVYVGTPVHLYKEINTFKTRSGFIINEGSEHTPYVRFDWRNELPFKDECMPIWLANQYIDTVKAEATVLKAYKILSNYLLERKIVLQDMCFILSQDGDVVISEVSPDCMRLKYEDEDMDKDMWRKGLSNDVILNKWQKLLEIIS